MPIPQQQSTLTQQALNTYGGIGQQKAIAMLMQALGLGPTAGASMASAAIPGGIAGAVPATYPGAAGLAASEAGTSVGSGGLGSAAGYGGLYLAAAMAADAAGRKMGQSHSPAVRKVGAGLSGLGAPWGVKTLLQGGSKQAAGAKFLSDLFGQTPMLSALGVWQGPQSAGGKFRSRLNSVINKTKFLGNLKVDDRDMYELSPDQEQTYSPEAQAAAREMAEGLWKATGADDPQYRQQTYNVLLNNLGNDIVGRLEQYRSLV